MTANTLPLRTRAGIWPALFVAGTTVMLAFRVANSGSNPVDWLHVAVGALSLGALVVLRHRGFARAAAYAFLIEFAGGIAIFATIDAPAVLANTPAIVRAVSLIAPHGFR